MRLCRAGRWNVCIFEVELPIVGRCGMVILVDVNGGVVVELVDVNGCCGASGWGIIFGGYEERSYHISSSHGVLGITDTSLCICSSQHFSILIRPTVCISINSLISSIVILLSRASL